MKISALSRSDTRTEDRFNFQDLQILAEAANYIRSLAPYRIMPPLRNKDGSPNPADRRYLIDPKTGFGPGKQASLGNQGLTIAKGYRFKGDPLIKDEDRYDLTGPAIQGPPTLGEHNMRMKLRQILQGGIPQTQVNYGKEMPPNYRKWSDQLQKIIKEGKPNWLEDMKIHTHNYPKA